VKKNILIWMLLWVFISDIGESNLFPAQVFSDSDVEYVVEIGDEATMNWTRQVIRVKGNGFGPENVKDLGRRKILAKRAAKMDAYRNLLEVISGIHITSNTSVKDMMLVSDSIKSKAEGMLKGMHVVDVAYSNEGGCEITVEVNINKSGKFLLTALDTEETILVDDYPKFDWIALRKEWEHFKKELARTKRDLDNKTESLQMTKDSLADKQKELKLAKQQNAVLIEEFNKKKNQLRIANLNLLRSEVKLKSTNLEKEDYKRLYNSTKKELKNTKNIVAHLKDILDDDIFKLAVEDKDLFRAQKYLVQGKKEVDKIWKEFKDFDPSELSNEPKIADLREYIRQTKKIQKETSESLSIFFEPSNTKSLDMPSLKEYTGLLIDARGFTLKQVIAPSVLTETGEKVYGLGVVPTTLKEGVIVGYLSGDLDKAKKHKKIGDQPLIIRVKNVANGYDVVIDDGDVEKLMPIYELLEQQKVAILI